VRVWRGLEKVHNEPDCGGRRCDEGVAGL
jgi:hypothetical protein